MMSASRAARTQAEAILQVRREARGRALTDAVLAAPSRMRTPAEAGASAARCPRSPGLFRPAGSPAWWSGAVTGWTVCGVFFAVAMVVQALVHDCQAVVP